MYIYIYIYEVFYSLYEFFFVHVCLFATRFLVPSDLLKLVLQVVVSFYGGAGN